MTTSELVEDILKNNIDARNSDNEVYLDYFRRVGLYLTPEQVRIFRDMPSFETLRRTRQKFQEQGKYPASDQVAKERRFKSYTMQQRVPQTEPDKIPQMFRMPEQWR